MRTERTHSVVFTLFLAGWMILNGCQATASVVALPTAAPRQAKAWFNVPPAQDTVIVDEIEPPEDGFSGEEGQEDVAADEGSAWDGAGETEPPQDELSGEEGQEDASADGDTADEDAQDGDAAADTSADSPDQASSDGGWGDGSSSVVQNRTSSEQQTIGDAEKKLQSALHTEVKNPDLSVEAVLGYDGIVTFMKPVPVEVTLKNSGAERNGSVCVNLYRTGSDYDRVEYPLYLPAGSEKRVRFYVTLTMKQDVFTVEYRDGDRTVASVNTSPSKTVPPEKCLIGVLSMADGSLSYLNIDAKNDALLRGEYFQTVPLSADSFPDTADALDAFGMLAVDGVDMTVLDDAQKAAFDAWLKAGGVVIVGGGAQAATDYPFFEPYTGVSAGALYQAEDITAQLLLSVGETGEALGQGTLLNRLEVGESTVSQTAEYGLVDLYRADGGVVFLAAFELGARPLTDWAGIGTLWQRILIKNAPDAYTGLFSGSSFGSGYDDYRVSQILSEMPVRTASSPRTPVIWLLGGFVAISGILMYFLLKKLDRRDLLWLTMPACALVAAFLIFRIGANSDAASPIATSYTWAILSADGQSAMTTGVGAATPSRKAVTLSAGSDLTLEPTEQNSFEDNYYGNDTFLKTPSQLRYVRTLGAENSVTLPAQAAWTLNALTATDNRPFEGNVTSSIWMEDDGLHGRVKNGTPYLLTDCAVVSSAGYADVGDLVPDQEAEFAILNLTDQEIDQLKAAKDDDYDYAPEGRICGAALDGTGGYVDVSAIFNAAVTKENRIQDSAKRREARNAMSGLERLTRSARQDMLGMCLDKWAYSGGWYGSSSDPFYRFYGFSDQIGAVQLTMDAAPVSRAAHIGMVDAGITYQPVGPTGLAFYPMGLIPAHTADADGGAPVLGGIVGNNQSFRVSVNPVFGFQIPDGDKMEDLSLSLQSRYSDQPPTIALYNARTGGWDEMTTAYLALKGDKLTPYLSADGTLYVRFSPGPKGDSYQEMASPVISVSGRMKK